MTSNKIREEIAEKALLIWGVPESVKNDFKAACAKKGIPMKSVIMDMMRGFIADVKKHT